MSEQISNKADCFELSLKAFIKAYFYPYIWDAFAYGGIELLIGQLGLIAISSRHLACDISTGTAGIAYVGIELLVSSGHTARFGDRLDNSPMWTHTSILRLDFRDLGRSRNVALKKFIRNVRDKSNARMDTSEVNTVSRVERHKVRCDKIQSYVNESLN